MIFPLLVFSAASLAMPEESLRELQSEELRQAYRGHASQSLQQLIMSEEAREQMLQQALFYAGSAKPVDNRAYLVALAVDLYHSLPPGPDPSGFEPGELGGKGDLMRQFQKLLGTEQRDIDRDEDWAALLRKHEGQSDNLLASIEKEYIRHYFREHLQLDDFIEHAGLDAQNLSFSNPTHYTALRAYVHAMQHRIRGGVAPWEEGEEFGGETAPAATGPAIPAAKATQHAAPIATPAPVKPAGMPSLLKLAIGALLVVAIVAFMITRGRQS